MTDFIVRLATDADLDALVAMQHALDAEDRKEGESVPENALRDILSSSIKGGAYYVAEAHGRVESGARVSAHRNDWGTVGRLCIDSVYTYPAYRRRGMARQVLQQILTDGAGLRDSEIVVDKNNQAAISLYSSFGFKPTGGRLIGNLSALQFCRKATATLAPVAAKGATFLVTKAESSDIDDIVAMQLALAAEDCPAYVPPTASTIRQGVTQAVRDGTYHVAIEVGDNRQVVACARAQTMYSDWEAASRLFIDSVYTKPEYRRRGIAKAILTQIIQGHVGADIQLAVSSTNRRALLLYHSLGFIDEGYLLLTKWNSAVLKDR